jgi:hypothetical protein
MPIRHRQSLAGAQRLVIKQLKEKDRGKVDQLAAGGGDLDKALRS